MLTNKSCINVAIILVMLTASIKAQSEIIVDRQAIVIEDNGDFLAGESNRFENFSGFYPADFFVLERETTLHTFSATGSVANPSSFPTNNSLEGVTIQIFNDVNGTPGGDAFADVFDGGNYGSNGVVYLPAVELGSGLELPENANGVTTFEIEFTTANGGREISLPAGGYWITVGPRTPNWHPGDPSGRWTWAPSIANVPFPRRVMSRTTFGDVEVWSIIESNIGNALAWQLTGEMNLIIGDVNGDGFVNLLDVDPFLAVLSSGLFQIEADINQDGLVDLLDVFPFVELLSL